MKENENGSEALNKAYSLLNVASTADLANRFVELDQRTMKNKTWDYQNPELLLNKVKKLVEASLSRNLFVSEYERDDLRDLLWLWYHHATGQAIWKYKDKETAIKFSAKACEYQIAENPNKISKLLYLLVRSKRKAAEDWLTKIIDEPDKAAAQEIMQEYLSNPFFQVCAPVIDFTQQGNVEGEQKLEHIKRFLQEGYP